MGNETRSVKSSKHSYTTNSHLVLSGDLNGAKRLFGGKLMSWIDITAAICAKRHADSEVVTAKISEVNFTCPAYANDIIQINARVFDVGNTSIHVQVTVFVAELNGKTRHICDAKMVFVSIDESGNKKIVPLLENS